jgi:uncharacterized protein with GYD domain
MGTLRLASEQIILVSRDFPRAKRTCRVEIDHIHIRLAGNGRLVKSAIRCKIAPYIPILDRNSDHIGEPGRSGTRLRLSYATVFDYSISTSAHSFSPLVFYGMLANFTDQGIRKVKDSPKRTDAFKDMAKKCGATVKEVFWTLGEYDIVAIVEAPDDISMTALGALGNVRTQTLRAFTPADMKTITGKMV